MSKKSGSGPSRLRLTVLSDLLAVCRLKPDSAPPEWLKPGSLTSLTWTDDETSIIAPVSSVPANVKMEGNWRAIKVLGPLDFSLTGILASLANPLAEAGISIFAMSTYDTDYLLVLESDLDAAVRVLEGDFDIVSRSE